MWWLVSVFVDVGDELLRKGAPSFHCDAVQVEEEVAALHLGALPTIYEHCARMVRCTIRAKPHRSRLTVDDHGLRHGVAHWLQVVGRAGLFLPDFSFASTTAPDHGASDPRCVAHAPLIVRSLTIKRLPTPLRKRRFFESSCARGARSAVVF